MVSPRNGIETTLSEPTYNLVYEALDPVRKFLADGDKFGVEYTNPPFERLTNLRLDAETPAGRTEAQQCWLAFTTFRDDLMDMVTNGDVNKMSDAYLRYFDGEVKRGQKLKRFHISRAQCHREYKPKYGTNEYTLYLVIFLEWE